MTFSKKDLTNIASFLSNIPVSGKEEAIIFASIAASLENAMHGSTTDFVDVTNVPLSVWQNLSIFMERIQMIGKDVQIYLNLIGKIQSEILSKNIVSKINDEEEFLNGDGEEQHGNRGEG